MAFLILVENNLFSSFETLSNDIVEILNATIRFFSDNEQLQVLLQRILN